MKNSANNMELIRQLQNSDKVMITASEASKCIGCNAQVIRVLARSGNSEKTLGFPTVICGGRVLIPRLPFLKMVTGGDQNQDSQGA